MPSGILKDTISLFIGLINNLLFLKFVLRILNMLQLFVVIFDLSKSIISFVDEISMITSYTLFALFLVTFAAKSNAGLDLS